MSRCGCTSAPCDCAVGISDCVAMSGTGAPGDPFVPVLMLSEDAGNGAECRDDGLWVPAPAFVLAQSTSNSAAISAATTLLTAPAFTVIAGHSIEVSFFAPEVQGTQQSDAFEFSIKEGATFLQLGIYVVAVNNEQNRLINLRVILSPSAGSHTYLASLRRTTGTGTMTVSSLSTAPRQLLVRDLG